ncbi:potassium-transporting ATPase subunit C [Buttiauxella brennerae ATCC 51605]|uniref:Potassium-transporting ATPase KdpC subunit n=1 Tax=Buttiauxella brennerae ATCC 51605 TaxID=1354251 RepID=A0A1B7IVT3_9ENTR|nr:potassium-transporting ATPase subunit KdpC [Buttiauxella brennerae]OAT34084.1 potassium-transporting ATPase subunit C [Buttiauxella brennerae ATCC 51605]
MSTFRPAIMLLILLTLITGGLYPLMTTLLAQWWFPAQANGSLIIDTTVVRGSKLIGQNFTEAKYLQGRPSATAETPYNPMASGGSNLAGSNPELDKVVATRIAALRAANPQANPAVPVELVTASASGLDGQISPQAAAWQIPRIAKARDLPVEQVKRLIAENTTQPLIGFMGKPVVNVLLVNVALDALQAP